MGWDTGISELGAVILGATSAYLTFLVYMVRARERVVARLGIRVRVDAPDLVFPSTVREQRECKR
eukprot:1165279-Amorphochlora_amoeboformis.AAC.1